jgi:trehalose utilization protein
MNRIATSYLSIVAVLVCHLVSAQERTSPIQVVVWDEQQASQLQAYGNYLGNEIAEYLSARPGLAVRSVKLDDAEQGLSDLVLDNCQVLIYWDHARHHEVKRETAQSIVERIKRGQIAMISLHSAHWSMPFIEAMHEVTRMRTKQKYASADQDVKLEYVRGPMFVGPHADSQITPRVYPRKFPDGKTHIKIYLPNCAFPGWREDGKPSFLTTLLPNHPIAQGIPDRFTLPATEMYDEPFHVPEPDQVIFEERWEAGEWFRSGCVWRIGEGRLFYFRPGHETYPVYTEQIPLKILDNAVRWLAAD